jgi:uncharacterized protein
MTEGKQMAVYFLDSSALVKRYRQEAGSEQVHKLIDDAERTVISRLAHVEVTAAIVRRGRAAATPAQELESLLARLDRTVNKAFDIVDLDTPIMERATLLARRRGLRGADAIQLACALLARNDATQQEFALVGSDQELNAAAVAEGLTVIDPTQT